MIIIIIIIVIIITIIDFSNNIIFVWVITVINTLSASYIFEQLQNKLIETPKSLLYVKKINMLHCQLIMTSLK